MDSVEQLFDFILKQKFSVVYGNLGREPVLLFEHLTRLYPNLEIHVVSPFYKFPENDNIHVNVPLTKCDLLLYLEPAVLPSSSLSYVSRTVVFTSHFALTSQVAISFYLSSNFEGEMLQAEELLKKQEASVQHRRADLVKQQIDFAVTKTLSSNNMADYQVVPGQPWPQFQEKTYVLVDLTQDKNVTSAFLHLLDAFDVLKKNVEQVEKWRICFAENMLESFEAHVQKHIDGLFCRSFTAGNVTTKEGLLQVSPFYSTASWSDRECTYHRFYCHKVYNPSSKEEAYRINVNRNVLPIKNWLFVEE